MTRRLELDDLQKIVTVEETAIDPDGAVIVFTRVENVGGVRVSSLWRVVPGGEPTALTRGYIDHSPRVMPDGGSVLFLRELDGTAQVHRLPLSGGEPVALTTPELLPLGAGPVSVSADGTRLAFAAEVDRVPAVDGSPVIVDQVGFATRGRGWRGARRRHVFVLDIGSGRLDRLTDGDWDADEPAWSPDGSRLAFTASTASDTDELREGCAWTIGVDEKVPAMRRAGHARGVAGPVVWTADGSAVVAVGSAEPRVGNAHLLRLAVETSNTADLDLTASLDRNVMIGAPAYPGGRPALSSDGSEVVFCIRDRGLTKLYSVGLDGDGCRSILAPGRHVVSGLSVATSVPRAAVVVTTPESFGEVMMVDLASGRSDRLTELTGEALGGVELLVSEEREFTVSDGTTVHGWLLAAPETTGSAPLLLDIHGGPHNAWSGVADEMRVYQQLLVGSGWRVLMINPRGSDGYGDEFFRAIDGAWGKADLADLLEPIDQLVAEGLADAERLAVTGYSYGGFAVCALTAHTDRFAAAIAGGLLCDLVGIAAERTDGAFFSGIAAGQHPAADPHALLAASPISRADKVRTPTLVLHGDADDACPVRQAQEWFASLRVQGVPSRLVVYPGADHLFIKSGSLAHRTDYQRRLLQWLALFTTPPVTSDSPPLLPRSASYWRQRLEVLRQRYGVVGAQFGLVRLNGWGEAVERTTVSAGVRDASRTDAVTDDSLFQIGSVTKVWTTVLIMQLVDEGRLSLDTPVREILSDFLLDDTDAVSAVTVRTLLSHTSGIEGDLITDTGPADDCIERYVASLSTARQLHPVGERFSYCNSGFVIAGRIVEVLRGMTWDEALRLHVIEPLGLPRTITLLEDAPRFATVTGHTGSGEHAIPVAQWRLPRSMGPAGLVCSNADDMLRFAQTLLRDGVAPAGNRLFSAEAAIAMRGCEVDLRDAHPTTDGWGLGVLLERWDGSQVFGHDGATIGQRAYLRVFPEHQLAAVLLTSGGRSDGLYRELFDDLASSCAGVSMPPAFAAVSDGVGAPPSASYGYADSGVVISSSGAGGLMTVIHPAGTSVEVAREEFELSPSDVDGAWAWTSPDLAGWVPFRPVEGGAYLGLRYLPAR